MRKRSAVTKPSSKPETTVKSKKTSAVERTAPLQYDDPDAFVTCEICQETSKVGDCTKNDKNGVLECAACGGPIETPAVKGAVKKPTEDIPFPEKDQITAAKPKDMTRTTLVSSGNKPPPFSTPMSDTRARAVAGQAFEPTPKSYCSECGSEWPIVNGDVWKNCGHASATSVDSPNKARLFSPPAGTARAAIIGNTLHVARGKHVFPTVPYGAFHVGPFSASAELGPGADIIEVARSLRASLKKIADEAFDDELKWYEEKIEKVRGVEPEAEGD